ncbi:sirohydrochlorin chelatase [Methylophaga sp. OBS1]|uniref:sirohydrochlorin chelatase n=1 Tax=Methylophaga sp. OBS1 TaxID=2991933 RepID=UPI00224D5684|nr:CbiX/SirB N-terminal domain-containing protein [Methylophaga sp. OBS1]MCX4191290.1 CbiX/SirB N-terminal domain-containing protein [Methylophaga sp. OBS1]MCX4191764.1 CbiX/SirB N-terminal domain-containing protein [Methylophaga sp. OBS1]
MKALLIVAHGSRRQASNQEVFALAEQLRSSQQPEFDLVEAAFLELADPSIPDGVAHCISEGANEVIVFPYFLNSGRHVTEDIPGILDEVRTRHPSVCIVLSQHIGASPAMPELVLQTATSHA